MAQEEAWEQLEAAMGRVEGGVAEVMDAVGRAMARLQREMEMGGVGKTDVKKRKKGVLDTVRVVTRMLSEERKSEEEEEVMRKMKKGASAWHMLGRIKETEVSAPFFVEVTRRAAVLMQEEVVAQAVSGFFQTLDALFDDEELVVEEKLKEDVEMDQGRASGRRALYNLVEAGTAGHFSRVYEKCGRQVRLTLLKMVRPQISRWSKDQLLRVAESMEPVFLQTKVPRPIPETKDMARAAQQLTLSYDQDTEAWAVVVHECIIACKKKSSCGCCE